MNINKDYSNIGSSLIGYRNYANTFHQTNHFFCMKINEQLISDLRDAHESLENCNTFESIKHQSNTLKAQLLTPWVLDNNPVIDSISFTIASTKEEATELSKIIQSGNFSQKNFHYSKINTDGNKRPYKFSLKIKSKFNKGAFLFIYMIKNSSDKDARHIRISFNPAKTGELFISQFFGALNRTRIIQSLREKIDDANITRLDVALDLVFFQIPFLVCETRQTVAEQDMPEQVPSARKYLESIYYGPIERTHTIIYDKALKYISRGHKTLTIDGKTYANITRIERVFKPQKGGGNIKLIEIHRFPCFLDGHKFYDPIFLRYVEEEQIAFIREFGYPLAECKYPELRTLREPYYMPINKTWFTEKQTEALLLLRNRMLSACR